MIKSIRALQCGFSLVETLITLLLSSLIMLAVSALLISGIHTWRLQTSVQAWQETERYVVTYLRRAIKQAVQISPTSKTHELRLYYVAEEGSRNCLGQQKKAGQAYTDVIRLQGDYLRCNGHAVLKGLDSLSFSYLSNHLNGSESAYRAVVLTFTLDNLPSVAREYKASLRVD